MNAHDIPRLAEPADLFQAMQFLALLDPNAKAFTFQTFDDQAARKSPALARIIHATIKDCWEQLETLNARGAGIFVAINATDLQGRARENIVRVRAVWGDFDNGLPGHFPLDPSVITTTSTNRFQTPWFCDGLSFDDHANVMNRIVRDYGADAGAKDLSRVLRLPGFFHRKGAPYRVEMVKFTEQRYSREELLAAFPPLPVAPAEPAAEPQPVDLAKLRSALKAIPHNSRDDRETWRVVGAALKHQLGEQGFDLWTAWSSPSEKYNDVDQLRVWRSFKRETGKIVGVGTIFHLAQKHGWSPKADAAAEFEPVAPIIVEPCALGEPFDLFAETATTPAKLTPDMAPAVLSDFAFDQAERLGVEPAMVLMPALVVCATAIPDDVRIQPLEHDYTWKESARLWTAVIADSGVGKTPAMRAATAPLQEIENEWVAEDAKKLARYEETKRQAKEDAKRGTGTKRELPPKPRLRRAIVTDFTMDQLAVILRDNERGVLVLCDELSGLIANFDAYRPNGVGKDRAAALELYNGIPLSVDRKREGASVRVPNWGASLTGGIQPDKLRKIAPELTDDGFLQRFQPFFGQRVGRQQDRVPDAKALRAYGLLIRRLAAIPADPCRAPITLSPGAHVWRSEVYDVAYALGVLPTTSGALRSHLEKWPAMYARVLLTLHMVECAAGNKGEVVVSGETARRARDLMLRFFLPNAERFYGDFFAGSDVRARQAKWLAGHILAHHLGSISQRDIDRAYRELKDKDAETRKAMLILEHARWVGPADTSRQGSTRWRVNPAVHGRFAERAAYEEKNRELTRREIAEAQEMLKRSRD